MIDFELPQEAKTARKLINGFVGKLFRELARKYDLYENEHKTVEELKRFKGAASISEARGRRGSDKAGGDRPANRALTMIVSMEEMCWADAALTIAMPGDGIGQSAIQAVATPEQKERFGKRMTAMAITEPGCGSDSSAIQTTAVLDKETNEWVLNGEKIFITGGGQAEALVVWATLDRKLGKPAIKSFVVDKSLPGVTLTKLEDKMGLRASDTAAIVLEDVRIPYDNILGSAEISNEEGFKTSRKFFDLTRPGVAIIGVGVARAALEFTREKLEEAGHDFSYYKGLHSQSAIERELINMEANLEVSRLLTWRAASMADHGEANSLEASMAKAKAGKAANQICQKCVELLGSMGYSCEWLVEKWTRDCKINDIYEGTGQIQTLIIARNILGFGRDMLK